MKRITLIALLLAVMLVTGSALSEALEAETAAPETHAMEGWIYPYLCQLSADSDIEESEMTLYFADGGDIPYVSLDEYMTFLSGLLAQMSYDGIKYNVERLEDDKYVVSRDDNGSAMFVNTADDSLFFINMNGLCQKVGSRAAVTIQDVPESEPIDLEEMAEYLSEKAELLGNNFESLEELWYADIPGGTDDGEDEAGTDEAEAENGPAGPNLFNSSVIGGYYYNRNGDAVELNLSDYMIDLIAVDGVCYIPFQTMNDLFLSPQYMQFVFTGEKVLGCSYGTELSDQRFEVPAGTFSEAFALFNYNELRFLLDSYYGLKPEHNIKDFGTLMAFDTDFVTDLAGTDPRKFDLALIQLISMYLDDGHSAFIGGSVLAGAGRGRVDAFASYVTLGPSSLSTEKSGSEFKKAREAVYGSEVPCYEEVGDTAFITFDSFRQNRGDEAYYGEDVDFDDPQDTIELIVYANRQIKREGSPVKNIVMDLSNNDGGRASAAVFVLSWFLGDAPIALRDTLTGAQTNMLYQCDVDLDGVYNAKADSVGTGYNLYCMTSVNSFSCGNLVPAACKSSGKVTMLGQTSGGGSCIVLPCTTASGALFQISGPCQLATIKNGAFYNTDGGIEPDIRLTKKESFYDRPALAEFLHAVK